MTAGAFRIGLDTYELASFMSTENMVWQLVVTLGIVAQLTAFTALWKRAYKVAGGAVAFTPALLLYAAFVVASGEGVSNPFPPPLAVFVALLTLGPLAIGLIYLARARVAGYPLWIAWAANWLPLAFIAIMLCCFNLEL